MSNDVSSSCALDKQLDPLLVEAAMALIAPAQHIALLAHEHPDGDCIGSALGFAHILSQLGKTCVPVGALLLRAGAIPETVVQPIYRTRPLAQVRFQAMIIANAHTLCNGRLIWSQATDAMLIAAGANPEMDENTSGMLRDIEGVEVAAFFKNYGDPTITRLSLRCAAPYNAAEICQRLSKGLGGGHARSGG